MKTLKSFFHNRLVAPDVGKVFHRTDLKAGCLMIS